MPSKRPPKQVSGKWVVLFGFPLIVSATMGVLILATQASPFGDSTQIPLIVCGAITAITGIGLTIAVIHAPRGPQAANCPHCDYRLTGLLSDRCPECGRAV